MANRKVVLLRYCKTEKGWRRYPVAIGCNGRIRPEYVVVDGEHHHYPDGHYELRSYQGSKAIYKNVGVNAADALQARDREVQLLIARDAAVSSGSVLLEEIGRVSLSRQALKFVQAAKDRGAMMMARTSKLAVDEFIKTTAKTYADQIVESDLTAHHLALKNRGCGTRTVHNRNQLVRAFLRDCGVSADVLKIKAPKYDKTLPEIYDGDDLKRLFASLTDPCHVLIFNLLLKTGLREQEAMYLEWPDISQQSHTLTIRSKPEFGFRIKDKEERSVPLAADLELLLIAYKSLHPNKRLVLGNSKDRPNTKLLRLLKRVVHNAGIDCRRCNGCTTRNECEKWFLHKFRATYCTQLLRSGLDLRTVQQMMGHSDIESTMRYLRPQENAYTQARLNSIQWTS